MLVLKLKLTDEQARNLLDAVSKPDTIYGPGDSHKSEDRKMVEAKIMVAIEEALSQREGQPS